VKIRAREASAVTGARVLAAHALPEEFGVSTDTRTLVAGEAYLALRGERFDGHDFIERALAHGASALIVADERVVPAGVPALVVAQTTHAYLQLGALARRQSAAAVVAITGSAGKTTTKAFLAQLLETIAPRRVVATLANENNEIGVAKLLLAIPADAAFVVTEFGARHPGEIAPLARAAAPGVAVLTNVGDAHLELMGSAGALADTKWGIFSTGARPVLWAADAVSRARAKTLGAGVCWFGVAGDGGCDGLPMRRHDGAVFLWHAGGRGTLGVVRGPGRMERYPVVLAIPGEHNLRNVVAAAAAAIALDVAAADVARAFETLALPPGRYERIDLGDLALIYDAYNASMNGTLATLGSFAGENAARRIAVLASMAELGDDAPAMHRRVGAAAAAAGLHALLVGGDYANDLALGARGAGLGASRIVNFGRNADAVTWLRGNTAKGDLVLLKGSRRYKLEEVVAGLKGAADA